MSYSPPAHSTLGQPLCRGRVLLTSVVANGQAVLRGGWEQSPAPIDQPQAEDLRPEGGPDYVQRGLPQVGSKANPCDPLVPASSFSHPSHSGPWWEKTKAMPELSGTKAHVPLPLLPTSSSST